MPSRECAVDFGRISRRLLFRRSCHIILTFHIFMTECELVPPKDREKNHAQARRLESSPVPSFAPVPSCWCESRLASVFRSCVRSGEFAKERGPGGARPRLTSPPSDARPSRPRHSRGPHKRCAARRRRGGLRDARAAPPRFRRRAPDQFFAVQSATAFACASPHRSVARAAPFADAPRLPEPPSRHTPWLTKARFPPSCAITAPAWSRCVPDHPRAPCERHRRSSGVPSAARF